MAMSQRTAPGFSFGTTPGNGWAKKTLVKVEALQGFRPVFNHNNAFSGVSGLAKK